MITTIARLVSCALLASILAGCGGAAAAPTTAQPASASDPADSVPTPAGSSDPAGASDPAGSVPTPAGQPSGSIDSCALLTDQEVEAGTGHAVHERKPSMLTRLFPSVCDIELEAGGELTIGIMSSGGRSVYETSIEPFIGDDQPPDYEAVEGLGDKAAIWAGAVTVLKEDILFDISWLAGGVSDTEVVVRYLAEVIVAKLPCLAQGCPGLTLPPPPSRAPVFDACSLLTEQEIEDATGYKAAAGESGVALGGDAVCSWALEGLILEYLRLRVREPGGREQFDFWAEAYETPPEHLPGLGDDAMQTATFPSGTIYVVEGDRLLTLEFSLPTSIDDPYAGYAAVLPLVESALSRLR